MPLAQHRYLSFYTRCFGPVNHCYQLWLAPLFPCCTNALCEIFPACHVAPWRKCICPAPPLIYTLVFSCVYIFGRPEVLSVLAVRETKGGSHQVVATLNIKNNILLLHCISRRLSVLDRDYASRPADQFSLFLLSWQGCCQKKISNELFPSTLHQRISLVTNCDPTICLASQDYEAVSLSVEGLGENWAHLWPEQDTSFAKFGCSIFFLMIW
jgi:hypothetical protein